MNKVIKPKTARGKRAIQAREPQVNEGPKSAIFLKGTTANQITNSFMKDVCLLKKPNSVFFNQKKDIKPFEDASSIEFLSKKTQSSLFMFASNSKKRPNNIVMGRTFDFHIMDMFELGIEEYEPMKDFKNSKTSWGSKPLLLFAGTQFDEEEDFKRLKNLLIDFFCGQTMDAVRLGGIEFCIQVVAFESKLYFRCYKLTLKSTPTKYSKLELEELGPRVRCCVRRSKLASEDLLKKALKKPSETRTKKVKNVKKSGLGTTLGRIHMTRQDYSKLHVKKMKGLKGRKRAHSESQDLPSANRVPISGGKDNFSNKSFKPNKKVRFSNDQA